MFDKLKKVWNDTRAESNVLVAIVTVVVATILIIIAAMFSIYKVGTQSHSKHSCFLNQLLRTFRSSQHHDLQHTNLQL